MSIFLEMELNQFPNFFVAFTLLEVTDPYQIGGMPLFDLADLLTLGGDITGSLGTSFSTILFSMDCILS